MEYFFSFKLKNIIKELLNTERWTIFFFHRISIIRQWYRWKYPSKNLINLCHRILLFEKQNLYWEEGRSWCIMKWCWASSHQLQNLSGSSWYPLWRLAKKTYVLWKKKLPILFLFGASSFSIINRNHAAANARSLVRNLIFNDHSCRNLKVLKSKCKAIQKVGFAMLWDSTQNQTFPISSQFFIPNIVIELHNDIFIPLPLACLKISKLYCGSKNWAATSSKGHTHTLFPLHPRTFLRIRPPCNLYNCHQAIPATLSQKGCALFPGF